MFRNKLFKIKNKTEWKIKSGTCLNVGTLKKENDLHYLYLDEKCTFSIEELEEILNICKKKVGLL